MQINSHLSVLIHDLANKYGDKPALTFKKFGGDQWQTVSWNQFSLRVKQVSNALLNCTSGCVCLWIMPVM